MQTREVFERSVGKPWWPKNVSMNIDGFVMLYKDNWQPFPDDLAAAAMMRGMVEYVAMNRILGVELEGFLDLDGSSWWRLNNKPPKQCLLESLLLACEAVEPHQ